MLMVRPVIKMNSWRKRKSHIMVFFIFMVSNMGGCLTPIGDPPLLMGFMRGVPFFWSLHLFPVLLFNMVILLFVFYHVDKLAYRKDIAQGRKPDISKPGTEFHIDGLHNIIFPCYDRGSSYLKWCTSGTFRIPECRRSSNGDSYLLGEVTLTFPALIEIVMILLAALLVLQDNRQEYPQKKPFYLGCDTGGCCAVCWYFYHHAAGTDASESTWTDILDLPNLLEMFWATGALSSFLDNTPTYLVFLTTAGTLGFMNGITTSLGHCAGETAFCNFLWCGIYGCEYLYWKCTELYGQVYF